MSEKLIIVFAVLGLGLGSLIVTPILTWILSRSKEKALEALKVYAEQGRDPPPELLKIIAGGSDWKAAWGMGESDMTDMNTPASHWVGAIMFGGIALGFGIGATITQEPLTHPFWIVTIVCGALAAASFAQALFSSRAK